MQNILYSLIDYFESLDFLREYKISAEFISREAKNIVVSIIYNSSSSVAYGESDIMEYIIQLDVISRHRADSYITTSEIINHFLTLRNVDIFKFSKNGKKENNKYELEGNLNIEESVYSFKDNYEENGYQRNTIRYISIFSDIKK